jgi:ATP synthase protein I
MSASPSDPGNRDGEQPAKRAGGSDDEESILASWYRMAGVGIEFVVAVGLFAAIGYGLDRWLNTKPWLMLVGMGLGFAVGLRSMIKLAMKSFKQ